MKKLRQKKKKRLKSSAQVHTPGKWPSQVLHWGSLHSSTFSCCVAFLLFPFHSLLQNWSCYLQNQTCFSCKNPRVPLRDTLAGQGFWEWDWRGNATIQRLDDSAPLQEDTASRPPGQGGRRTTFPGSWLDKVANTWGLSWNAPSSPYLFFCPPLRVPVLCPPTCPFSKDGGTQSFSISYATNSGCSAGSSEAGL